MLKNKLFLVSTLALSLILVCCQMSLFAQTADFDKDTSYDIYYEVTKGRVDAANGVRIIELVDINGKQFLRITGSSLGGKQKEGYILFDTIKAILPSGYIKAEQGKPILEMKTD